LDALLGAYSRLSNSARQRLLALWHLTAFLPALDDKECKTVVQGGLARISDSCR
jgi:hypothetical protein